MAHVLLFGKGQVCGASGDYEMKLSANGLLYQEKPRLLQDQEVLEQPGRVRGRELLVW